ncbi:MULTISPECIES: hypothetical protein [Cysteiniphilum]|uniref:hypothetical protein n=1 Tax=Cysteiniphilum TaxID=2056696 RepID=UPI00177D5842|nr:MULTISPECIES: hypothetical protein [Cysteiniphilum]
MRKYSKNMIGIAIGATIGVFSYGASINQVLNEPIKPTQCPTIKNLTGGDAYIRLTLHSGDYFYLSQLLKAYDVSARMSQEKGKISNEVIYTYHFTLNDLRPWSFDSNSRLPNISLEPASIYITAKCLNGNFYAIHDNSPSTGFDSDHVKLDEYTGNGSNIHNIQHNSNDAFFNFNHDTIGQGTIGDTKIPTSASVQYTIYFQGHQKNSVH